METTEQSILILERQGYQIDWVSVDYFSPFENKEERDKWLAQPENSLGDDWKMRYVVAWLKK